MKWVTYYTSFLGGLSDVTVHKDRETATRFFNRNYGRYFQLAGREKFKLPMMYGFIHRRFCGESMAKFKKRFPEWREPKAGGKRIEKGVAK